MKRSILADLLNQSASDPVTTPDMPEPVASGALRAMGLSLEKLSAEAERGRELSAQLTSGQHIVELDPGLIDASFVADRIAVEVDHEFESFTRSIEEQGQQVPVLVRPHPDHSGRYQIAYGHRRVRAAKLLGRPVKAILRELSDVELVIAQAKENIDRSALSFIERATFAGHLEERGFDRATIMSALSVDKGDLSRMLAVVAAIPASVINAIGPAPKIGRPRWVALAELMKTTSARKRCAQVIAGGSFKSALTDKRFALVFDALQPKESDSAAPDGLLGRNGALLARIAQTPKSLTISVAEEGFRRFLLARLGGLVEEYERNPNGADDPA